MYRTAISPKLTLAFIWMTAVGSESGQPSTAKFAKAVLESGSTRYFSGTRNVSSPKEQLASILQLSAISAQAERSTVSSPKEQLTSP